jgi:4-hydroxy-3-polyprenylbenzoate decarboxylase
MAQTQAETGAVAGDLLAADVRDVMDCFEQSGQLRRVQGADWSLELGAITELMALRNGPSLLFDSIEGYPQGHRVYTNMLNSPQRVAQLIGLPPDTPALDLVRAIRTRFTVERMIDPVHVDEPRFREVSRRGADVDMLSFPSPLWHEGDGGRYFGTACIVITRDPDGGWVNLGTYRIQVHDRHTLGIFVTDSHHGALIMQRYWEKGERAPVAVCVGVPAHVLLGSFLGVPWGVSEYSWAGGLAGRPVEVVEGEITGLPLPSSAEIVVEGFCPPPEGTRRLEGPFGETLGYYGSGAREEPVIEVELVQHRHDPILVGSPPMRPPASSSATHLFRAANLWTEIERAGIPDVRGVWMIPAGSSSLLAVVAIRQRYGGHAKQTGLAAMSGRAGGGQLGRFVIVVDDDIDPTDVDQVLWAVATRCDPVADIDVLRNCVSDFLDPRLSPDKRRRNDYTASRAVVVACRPYHWRDEFPKEVGTSAELRERVVGAWPDLFT